MQDLRNALVVAIMGLVMGGCATDSRVGEVDTSLSVKGTLGERVVGLNHEGQAILQEENRAAHELMIQENVNERLRDDLAYERHTLKRCREDVSDPRLGGSGELRAMLDAEDHVEAVALREEFGVGADGELKVVKKQDFLARLKAEREHERNIRQLIKLIRGHKEACEYRLKQARIKSKQPEERLQVSGSYDAHGTWHQEPADEA